MQTLKRMCEDKSWPQTEALTAFTPEKKAKVCFTPGLNLCGATICTVSYRKEQTYLRKNVNAFKHLTRKTGTLEER